MQESRFQGFSLIELIVVLAVVAILSIGAVVGLRAPAVTVFSNDAKALLLQARLESIKRDQPVVVRYRSGELTSIISAGVGASVVDVCASDLVLVTQRATAYGSLEVAADAAWDGGLVWLANGQARLCPAGAVFSELALQIDDGRISRRVTVSLAGRVEIQ